MSEDDKDLLTAYLSLAVRAEIKAEALALYLLGGNETGLEGFRAVCREVAARNAQTAPHGQLAAIYRQLAEEPKT